MISKGLLNLQALKLINSFKQKHSEVWDIVVYGSFVRGKISVQDIDLAIILSRKTSLNEKLKFAQELKHSLKEILKAEIDVKSIDMQDLMDPLFIARKAIIAEGFSLTRKKSIAEIFGFGQFYIFAYKLKGLSHSEKVMFRYALGGRRGQKGMLEINKCEQIGKGAIKAPLQHAEEFRDFLEKYRLEYRAYMALLY